MRPQDRAALAAARLNWAVAAPDLWADAPFHIPGLHVNASQLLAHGIENARESAASSPIGVVLVGQPGAGKTHMLGMVRKKIHDADGYFFPVHMFSGHAFWRSAILSVIEGLNRPWSGNGTQLQHLLVRLAEVTGTPEHHRRAVTGQSAFTLSALETFIEALRAFDRGVGLRCQNTARALVLLGSQDLTAQDVGNYYLTSSDELPATELLRWGIRGGVKTPQEITQELSALLSLTGPTVIAIDQIDSLLARSARTASGEGHDTWQQGLLLEHVAGGLMTLREVTQRTLIIAAVLPTTWELIANVATGSIRDRFQESERLSNLPGPQVAEDLVGKRLAVSYATAKYSPPYPTWPVRPEAFAAAAEYTPRHLLMRIDRHIRQCLERDNILELRDLGSDPFVAQAEHAQQAAAQEAGFAIFDSQFAQLYAEADVAKVMTGAHVDALMPALLSAGVQAWIAELGEEQRQFRYDPQPGNRPALHARMRQTIDEAIDDEQHWAFKAIPEEQPIAVISRIRNAAMMAGLTPGLGKRALFLIRNTPWPQGPKTSETLETFREAGGILVSISEHDLKSLYAIQSLLAEPHPDLQPWLRERRPAHNLAFLTQTLGHSANHAATTEPGEITGEQRMHGFAERFAANPRTSLLIGTTLSTQSSALLEPEALRQHVAIFAGSGSGKSQLMRRILEESALQGISSVVLDVNNDFARMGERWPAAPAYWGPRDQQRSEQFLATTDVAVWTPLEQAGCDLRFSSIPAVAALTLDELHAAVETTLVPLSVLARCDAETGRAVRARAVLREALTHYLRNQGRTLTDFLDLLANLPSHLSAIENGRRIAAELSASMRAATVNNPLVDEGQQIDDVGVLLIPPPGKLARISVVSMIGLPSQRQRQLFASQLQMALFTWIKTNPAEHLPVRALLALDEAQSFAPQDMSAVSTMSTVALAAQGRKYGLGLILSSHGPRGLNERLIANAATQLIGRMNSPADIVSTHQVAEKRGGDTTAISRLPAGSFYLSAAGKPFELINTYGCLSNHPVAPLTAGEVLAHAKATAAKLPDRAPLLPEAHAAAN